MRIVNTVSKQDRAVGWDSFVPPGANGLMPWAGRRSLIAVLFALLLAACLAIFWAIPHFENRLDASVKADLAAAGIDTETLEFDWTYRNVVVSGVLPEGMDEAQLANVVRLADGSGARNILIAVDPAPTLSPDPVQEPSVPTLPPALAVSVNSRDGTVELAGTVLSARQRDALVNASLVAEGVVNINDNLEIVGDGETDEQSDARLAVLADLLAHVGPEQVASAQATLTDSELSYRIKAKDRASAEMIEQAVSVALVDFQVTGEIDHVKAGEVDITANRDKDTMTLAGSVLSEEQRMRLMFAAEEAVGEDGQVNDQIEVSGQEARLPGADARVDNLVAVIGQLGSSDNGRARLHADTLSISAELKNQQTLDQLKMLAVKARQRGMVTEETLSLIGDSEKRQAQQELQTKFDALALEVQRNVLFDTGTARLTSTATATLDKVSEVILQYPDLLIEVEGHTDNRDRDEVNNRLSEARAKSVVEYLVGKSVAAERMQPVGYGDRVPVASNDTPEGRSQNRRVQFTAVDSFQILRQEQ